MNIILGAGLTGLAAGIKTGFPIYEMTDKAGGICRSYEKEGFQFSKGGPHFLFGKGIGLDYIKSLVEVNEYDRIAGIYYNHIFPYPFQTTAEKEFVANAGSMKAWMGDKFGKVQCNLFFDPFNEKYTAGLYDEVIQADEYKSPPPGGKGFVSTFCDPVNGLTELVDKMSAKCDIKYNKKLTRIDIHNKIVGFEDGDSVKYDKLISTIPLNKMSELCGRHARLPYTSVLVINIGADIDVNTPCEHWLYIPFCKSGFHRIVFYSNVDKKKAPFGEVGLAVEIAFQGVDYKDLDVEDIVFNVVEELQAWGFIGRVITVDPTWIETAYTWMYAKAAPQVEIDWLKEEADVISTGRYGSWKFCGMVESIKQGLEVNV